VGFTITINATDRSSRVGYRSLQITKDGAMESAVMRLITPDGYRPGEGDAVRITRSGGHLEMGGEVARVVASRLNGGGGGKYVTGITVRGWFFEAQDIVVWASFPAQGLFVTAEALRSMYMASKGWTNLSPTTGGPSLPALTYSKQSLRAIFDDLTKRSGYPWRVNGDRQFGFVQPGGLVSSITIGNSNTLLGVEWERDRTRRATRLLVTTGGSGVALHTETHTANGAQSSFPVNVLPNEQAGTLNAAAASSATSVVVRGLRASSTLTTADTFRVAGGATTHTVASNVTTDSNGDATVTFTPGLAAAVLEGDAIVFDAGTFVRLQVNGVDTSLTAGVWSFDHIEGRFVKTGALPTAGTTVKYLAPITSPATIRAWDTSTRNLNGSWNYAAVRDAEVQASDKTDFASTKAWADAELASRMAAPKKLKVLTKEQGLYPWLRQPVNLPGLGLSGDYLINRVVIRDVGAKSTTPRVELELLEGDAIGRDWTAWWRERQGSTVGGSVTVGVGGGGTGTGGGTGVVSAAVPAGSTIDLGGDNQNAYTLSTTWTDAPQAKRKKLGGSEFGGTWELWVPLFQLAAGTLEARLYDQTAGAVVAGATVSTTQVSALLSGGFAYPTVSFSAPGSLDNVVLQWRVTSGTRKCVMGNAQVVKL
jgi:hypothetical protein